MEDSSLELRRRAKSLKGENLIAWTRTNIIIIRNSRLDSKYPVVIQKADRWSSLGIIWKNCRIDEKVRGENYILRGKH